MAERRSNTIFWVLGGIGLLSVAGLAITIAISSSNDVSDGYIPPEERDRYAAPSPPQPLEDAPSEPDEEARRPAEGAAREARARDYDEAEIAQVLADGGAPRQLRQLDPTPTRIGPTPPELALERAHIWQGLLDTQAGELRQRLEEAEREGNRGLATRLERQLARLEAQREPLRARIDELDQALERHEASVDREVAAEE